MRVSDLRRGFRHVFTPRSATLWLIVSLLVSFAGPFGTYASMRAPVRLAYWGLLLGGAVPVASLCRRAARPWLIGLGRWGRGVSVSLIFATVYAPFVYLVTLWLEARGLTTIVPVWVMWIAAVLSSISESAIWMLMKGAPPPAPEPEPQPVSARLLARLGPDHPGPILALSVRDHYVVVTTAQGQASLLMRFADAMAELDGVAGMQIHRSHWVAFTAVHGVVRAQGKTFLQLVDGRRVPVSRSYIDAVVGRWPAVPLNGTGLGGSPSKTARAAGRINPRSNGSVQDIPPV
ncbi:MAG: hypothetical protein GC186_10860 [Rhodobacteraceae bacterium]|nr:hypothetical protein [Paracoccaceae bacterium]